MVFLGNRLVKARFQSREKRFIVFAKVGSRSVKAFLSQTGRLTETLSPGATLLLRRTQGATKLPFEVLVAYDKSEPVTVDSRIPNQVVEEAFRRYLIKPCPEYAQVLREQRVENHRLDFVLLDKSPTYVEVKGCTMKTGSSALYPDAPTERGREHLKLLTRLREKGLSVMLVFVAMRSDVSSFKVNSEIDHEFARLLRISVQSGTRVLSYSTRFLDGNVKLYHKLRLEIS